MKQNLINCKKNHKRTLNIIKIRLTVPNQYYIYIHINNIIKLKYMK